ncbi:MAG: hypothetical protein ACKVX7_05255 [Planctomycetota bacterium]
MGTFLSAILFVLAPLAAAALPYFCDRFGVTRQLVHRLQQVVLRHRKDFLAMPRIDANNFQRSTWKYAAQGVVMIICMMVTLSTASAVTESGDSLSVVVPGIAFGLLLGVTLLVGSYLVRLGLSALRPIHHLTDQGYVGVWASKESMPFRRELLAAAQQHKFIEILCGDGSEELAALSHPAHAPLTAPHPALRGVQIRMLLLPPRNSRQHPEAAGYTIAEMALAKMAMSPEEHWRRLHTTLETKERWEAEFGANITVHFMEVLPAFRSTVVGPRAWFRPWEECFRWHETAMRSDSAELYSVVRSHFLNAWIGSSPEIKFSLTAGPTKSTFIRNGVDVPTEASRLMVEDEDAVQI